MKPIINPWWIYLVDKSESAMVLFTIVGVALMAMSGIWWLAYMEGDTERSPKKVFIIAVISLLLSVLLPSQETVYTMMTVKYITPNNIKAVGSTVESTIDYIIEKIDEITDENDK